MDSIVTSQLTFQISPENEELHQKDAELATLKTDLVQGELDLTTLHAELQNFEREYQQIIVTRYVELEHIEEQIAEYMAYLESTNNFRPSEDFKKLYREVAKLIHPDLTTDPVEKNRPQELMIEANQAYEVGDVEKLKAILYSWESNPESIQGQGIAAELIRSIRKIAQCRERLVAIKSEISEVKQTELYQLKSKVAAAREFGQDLLADMAQKIDEQIEEAQEELREIREG